MVCHVSPSLCTAAAKGDTETVEKHLHAQCCNPFATQYFINPDCDSHSQSAIVGLTRRKRTVYVSPKNGDDANAVKPATPLQVALYFRQEGVLFQLLNHFLKIANGNVARCYDETAELIATANGYTHLMDFFQYYDNYNNGRETFATCWTEAMRHICDLTSKVVKYRKQIAELMSEKDSTVRSQVDTQAFTSMLDQKDQLIQKLQFSLQEKDDQLAKAQTQSLLLQEQLDKITGRSALSAIATMSWRVEPSEVGVEIAQTTNGEQDTDGVDHISQCLRHHLGLTRRLEFFQDYFSLFNEQYSAFNQQTLDFVGRVEDSCAWNFEVASQLNDICHLLVPESRLHLFEVGDDGIQALAEMCQALDKVGPGEGIQQLAATQLSKALRMKEILDSSGIIHEDSISVLHHVMSQLQKVLLSPDITSLLTQAEDRCGATEVRIKQCVAEKVRCEEMGSVLAVEKELHRQMSLQRQLLDIIRDKLDIVQSKSEEAEIISGLESVCQTALSEITNITHERELLQKQCEQDWESLHGDISKRTPELLSMHEAAAKARDSLQLFIDDNDAAQKAEWEHISTSLGQLCKLSSARSDVVRKHLEVVMNLKRLERENEAFMTAANAHLLKLKDVSQKCKSSLDVCRLISELLVDCAAEVKSSVTDWQGQVHDIRQKLHREFYERFTDWYLTQGEYTHKKKLLLLDVRRKISETQNLKRLAIQRLDSAAEQHGEILTKLEQQRSDLEEVQLPRLEDTLRAALALFEPTQRFLEENGIAFTHPEVELQKWNEHREMEIHMAEVSKYQELLIHSQKALLESSSSMPVTERLMILENQQRIQTQHNQLETLARERDSAKAKTSTAQEENRRLKEALQKDFVMIPLEYLDPITLEIMVDPVVAADDHTYERETIERWLTKKQTSPRTNEPFKDRNLRPNLALRATIEEWKSRQLELLKTNSAEQTAVPLTPPSSPQAKLPTSPVQV